MGNLTKQRMIQICRLKMDILLQMPETFRNPVPTEHNPRHARNLEALRENFYDCYGVIGVSKRLNPGLLQP